MVGQRLSASHRLLRQAFILPFGFGPGGDKMRPMRVSEIAPDPLLSPVILGPSKLIASSAALRWRGVLMEKHACDPGERPEGNALDRSVLVMVCSPTWRGECKATNGLLKRETLGTLTILQSRSVDCAGADGVDANASVLQIGGPCPSKRTNRCFRCTVNTVRR